jgi:hypothetical protein
MIGPSPGIADGGENLGGGAHGSGSYMPSGGGNGGKGIVVIRVPFPL